MPARNEFVDHVVEMLKPFGAVTVRRMFGAWGLYREGVFFALIADDVLYLKADAGNAADFDQQGLEPFVFRESRGGEDVVTSYRRAPDEALENPHEMTRWAKSAYGAALRRQARKKPGKKKTL